MFVLSWQKQNIENTATIDKNENVAFVKSFSRTISDH